ncbi:MAG TPA: macrocin O-methyltransferase, partial [Cyanobacteria bacterium UBA8543]|nr:macrocin O-methyltransferase [Cyanobacteria bacterium UBA8543]
MNLRKTIVQSFIIITAANAQFFELVQGTILSIRQKPQGQDTIIGFFDLGCTPEQLQWLQGQVNVIKQADWEFNFPLQNEAPEYLKGLLARPFLRQYFPNFDIYLWIDADAW